MRQVCDCCDYVLEKASRFTILDFAILKTALLSIGILFGAIFSKFFKRYQAFLWLIAACSYIYLIYRLFIKGIYFERD
ncbi:MAG: hypothetical protein N2Z65_01680 [Clostridiales bacterium]|nr:hypothetical protein [Clostridiales bacterium]